MRLMCAIYVFVLVSSKSIFMFVVGAWQSVASLVNLIRTLPDVSIEESLHDWVALNAHSAESGMMMMAAPSG